MGGSHGLLVIARRVVSSAVYLSSIGRLSGNLILFLNPGQQLTNREANAVCFSEQRYLQEHKGTYRLRFTRSGHPARPQIQFKNLFNSMVSEKQTKIGNALLPEHGLVVKSYTNRSTALLTTLLVTAHRRCRPCSSKTYGKKYCSRINFRLRLGNDSIHPTIIRTSLRQNRVRATVSGNPPHTT